MRSDLSGSPRPEARGPFFAPPRDRVDTPLAATCDADITSRRRDLPRVAHLRPSVDGPAVAVHRRVRSFVVMVVVAGIASWAVGRNSSKTAEATERVVRPREVQSVAIDGRGDLPMANLRAALSTRIGEQLDDAKLAQDRAALESVLVTRGYLDAHVAKPDVVFDADQAAFVVFHVELGAQFHVRSVEVKGASARDAGVVTLASGEVMRPELIERARAALAERLRVRGKHATVVATVRRDAQARAVDVELAAH